MVAVISILIVLACILLITVVFVQNPKGGGLSNDFGAQQIGGVQRTTDFVEKATWVLSIVIVGGSFVLSSLMKPAQTPMPNQNGKQTENGQGAPKGQGAPAPKGQPQQ